MESRMGYDTRANHTILSEAMLRVIDYIWADAEETEAAEEANELWKVGAFICIGTSCSLRGYEGFYVDLSGLRKICGAAVEDEFLPF